MSQPSKTTDALIKTLRFTPEDLKLNRNGFLSPAQKRRVHGMAWQKVWPYLSFGVMCLLLGAFMAISFGAGTRAGGSQTNGMIVAGIGFFAGILGIISLFRAIQMWQKASKESRKEELKVIGGPIKCSIERDKRGDDQYIVRIGSQKFEVPQQQYAAFEDGHRYRLYYTSLSRKLLAAEIME
jgi:hypothetical protein